MNKSEDFIILDNHGNPFVGSDNLFDASSVDTKSVGMERVDDHNDTSFDSEDSSSDNESENSGMSDRRLLKEGVNATHRQENEEQQGQFNMRSMRGNLPPPRVSHRSGLRQPKHVNYTHTIVSHTNTNSKSKTKSTPINHNINNNGKRQSTPKQK